MLTEIMLASWACFAICGAWYFGVAKQEVPISPEDAEVMWKLHKQSSSKRCRKWHLLKHKTGKPIGFQCDCGYKYTQKKPIVPITPLAD